MTALKAATVCANSILEMRSNESQLIRALIRAGASTAGFRWAEWGPILCAVKTDAHQLKAMAERQLEEGYRDGIVFAAFENQLAIVEALLAAGANPNQEALAKRKRYYSKLWEVEAGKLDGAQVFTPLKSAELGKAYQVKNALKRAGASSKMHSLP